MTIKDSCVRNLKIILEYIQLPLEGILISTGDLYDDKITFGTFPNSLCATLLADAF